MAIKITKTTVNETVKGTAVTAGWAMDTDAIARGIAAMFQDKSSQFESMVTKARAELRKLKDQKWKK